MLTKLSLSIATCLRKFHDLYPATGSQHDGPMIDAPEQQQESAEADLGDMQEDGMGSSAIKNDPGFEVTEDLEDATDLKEEEAWWDEGLAEDTVSCCPSTASSDQTTDL